MYCLHDRLYKKLLKLGTVTSYLYCTLNEYVLGIWLNILNFLINHEFESFNSGISDMTESNFMSRMAA